jgi:hypothetical protein
MQGYDVLFEEYMNANHGYNRTEGAPGVRALEQISVDMGYSQGEFLNANPILNMLADNPGMIEAIHEFIYQAIPYNEEWQEALNLDSYAEEMEEEEELVEA